MSRRTPSRATSRAPLHAPGRHELGQSFLVDRRAVADVVDRVAATRGPILEIGPGDGALTLPLARLGRPIRALELDARRAARLDARTPGRVRVEHADALAHRFDAHPHVVVSNLPFHITTALLRRLLAAPGWTDAVLIAQWEVARRRAGVGGATQLTAQAAPWFEFSLGRRIPRSAFRPMPQVDAGLFAVQRRAQPLVDPADRRQYAAMVARVFASPGAGLAAILPAAGVLPRAAAKRWLRERSRAGGLPRDLGPEDWADLWLAHRRTHAP
ncbi:23S ribosomal RNA methyltransferase Erm [Agrococcus sp. Marseille-Q4369]|uniref:23S ribosomal RNA methyltransferase Erm n=1 Tax=Agrococcus sp. Marseille-Q4369 TaxID=2810513 RepID=UPI001B8B20E3|nr:23S ribosomal RNA methyltransferase Erm [Agrococcus sp. Marseille-Q4369]QUW18204.1 23S ribosomal RNA methyltransferase Erm [Agrococcus sp. Marseille-Q4369]